MYPRIPPSSLNKAISSCSLLKEPYSMGSAGCAGVEGSVADISAASPDAGSVSAGMVAQAAKSGIAVNSRRCKNLLISSDLGGAGSKIAAGTVRL